MSIDEASRAGKTGGEEDEEEEGAEARSTTVIVVWKKTSRCVKARAVERPKTPAPMMRIEDGGVKGEAEAEGAAGAVEVEGLGKEEVMAETKVGFERVEESMLNASEPGRHEDGEVP